jgi:hypothetical protein
MLQPQIAWCTDDGGWLTPWPIDCVFEETCYPTVSMEFQPHIHEADEQTKVTLCSRSRVT